MYHVAYLIVRFVNLLQVNPHRVFPRLVHGDETDPVGGKVCMTILIIGDLVFANSSQHAMHYHRAGKKPRHTLHTTPPRPGQKVESRRATARDAKRWSGPEP